MKNIRKVFILPIKFYRKYISPMKQPCCRFYPTCSQYAITAIERFGVKGILLALWRILRCNPYCRGGIDYVPDKFTFKRADSVDEAHVKQP